MSPKTLTGEELQLDDGPARDSDLFLVDGNNLAYRAFYALPEELATSEGFSTNALLGFANMLFKLLADYRPRGVAVAWDTRPVHRTEQLETYKIERKPMPDLLREQFPYFRPIVEAFGYRNLEFEGWEADDVIATLAQRADEAGIKTTVVSTDRDAFQLVSDNVALMMTPRGVSDVHVYTPERVELRLGIKPEQVPDFIGLKGDSSDNIPGVPGIGDKTAGQLIAQYGSLEDVLEHVDELTGGLVADAGDARDVVARISLEPDEVRDLLRADPVARLDALRRVHLDVGDAARGHHQADVLRDELERVAVGRDDARLHACLVSLRRERRDHVVRLPPLELEVLVPERLDDRSKVRELLAQEVRHGPPLGLVLRVDLLAVHRSRVPRDGDAARLVVGQELEEHVGEAEERVRRLTVGGLQLLREREERAVREVVPVDEEELGVAGGRVVEDELLAGQGLRHPSTLWADHRSKERCDATAKRSPSGIFARPETPLGGS